MKLKYRQRNRLTLQTSLNMRVPWIQCLTSVWDCFSPGPYPLHQRCPNDYLILYTHTTYFWGMSSIMSLVDTLLPSHGRGKDAMVSDPGIRLVGFTKLWASRRRVDRYIYICCLSKSSQHERDQLSPKENIFKLEESLVFPEESVQLGCKKGVL